MSSKELEAMIDDEVGILFLDYIEENKQKWNLLNNYKQNQQKELLITYIKRTIYIFELDLLFEY